MSLREVESATWKPVRGFVQSLATVSYDGLFLAVGQTLFLSVPWTNEILDEPHSTAVFGYVQISQFFP